MLEITAITLFVAGLLGSTHCLAMCGGIASALGASRGPGSRLTQPLLYQVGRITSYSIAGGIAGATGAAGVSLATAQWAQVLRLLTALIVVLIGLKIALGPTRRARWMNLPERLGALLWRRIGPYAQRPLPVSGNLRAFTLGMIWGWLPCGLVYSALIAAAVAGSFSMGAGSMLAFGLGTLPAMLGISAFGSRLPRPDGPLARIIGTIIVACGLWTAAMPIAAISGRNPHAHHIMLDHGTMGAMSP